MNFKPEFLNRVDEVIIFNALTKEHIKEIIKIHLGEAVKRLKERGILLEFTPRAIEFIVKEGYDPQYGARPLKRAIQKLLLNPLSVRLLGGEIFADHKMKVDAGAKGLKFT